MQVSPYRSQPLPSISEEEEPSSSKKSCARTRRYTQRFRAGRWKPQIERKTVKVTIRFLSSHAAKDSSPSKRLSAQTRPNRQELRKVARRRLSEEKMRGPTTLFHMKLRSRTSDDLLPRIPERGEPPSPNKRGRGKDDEIGVDVRPIKKREPFVEGS